MDDQTQILLQGLPAVDRLLELAQMSATLREVPHAVLRNAARTVLEALRHQLLQDKGCIGDADVAEAAVMRRMEALVAAAMTPRSISCASRLLPIPSSRVMVSLPPRCSRNSSIPASRAR